MGSRVELKCDPATGMTRVGTALEQGTMKLVGETHFAWAEIVGIVLDDKVGLTNGSKDKIQYFACKDNHGIFVRPEAIVPIRFTIRVSRLDDWTSEADLFQYFNWYGKIDAITYPWSKRASGKKRARKTESVAYICFADYRCARDAVGAHQIGSASVNAALAHKDGA